MKIKIINENFNENIEIDISQLINVDDIKILLEKSHGKYFNSRKYLNLIHRNIILLNNKCIKFYKIQSNDQMWFGKTENYLKNNDVIVEVFLARSISEFMRLIAKKNDSISKIRSIIGRIIPNVGKIWNLDGIKLRNDQIVTDIDIDAGFYKLVISCDDRIFHRTFDDCCKLHDLCWIESYLFYDVFRNDIVEESIRNKLINRINQIKQIISSNDVIDSRLNENLSKMPISFVNSKMFFCLEIAYRIQNIYFEYLQLAKDDWLEVHNVFNYYSIDAILAALFDYVDARRSCTNKTDKSMKDILIDSLDNIANYWNNVNLNFRYWMRLWVDRLLLRRINEHEMDDMITQFDERELSIQVGMHRGVSRVYIQKKPETVLEAKEAISSNTGVDIRYIYCIEPGGDHKPHDKDTFDYRYILEIVSSVEDVELLKILGQGTFGTAFLYEDKISKKKFVLKKQLKEKDLYRDISIQCRLRYAQNIAHYFRLFNIDDRICFATEYMAKGSLSSHLKKIKSFSEKEIAKISYQILLQIMEMHEQKIIHRDIKCDNVVLDDHLNVKLIDFGLAKCTENLSEEQLKEKLVEYKPGTMCYMAPEIINSENYTNKIDIWSFGVMMTEMITKRRPYYNNTLVQAVIKISETRKIEFDPPELLSKELKRFIDLCLQPDSDFRPEAKDLIKSKFIQKYLKDIKK